MSDPATGRRGLVFAAGAAAAATGLWIGMSLATSLIWHFHPAIPGAAGGWAYRRGMGRPGSPMDAVGLATLTAVVIAVGATAITAGDGNLDAAWFVALVAVGGLALGIWLLTRAR